MSKEHQALVERRQFLLETIAQAADQIRRIDLRLSFLQNQEADN